MHENLNFFQAERREQGLYSLILRTGDPSDCPAFCLSCIGCCSHHVCLGWTDASLTPPLPLTHLPLSLLPKLHPVSAGGLNATGGKLQCLQKPAARRAY
ncbi:hypothetical protein AOLI_G00009170 [Acnodon oligacanthus]